MSTVIPPPPRPSRQDRSGLALASLVLGVMGIILFIVGPVLGVAAIICGYRARSEIRKSNGRLTGGGMALAGIISGYVASLVLVVGVLTANFLAPKTIVHDSGNSREQCIENLQLIQGYKEKWALDMNKPSNAVPRERELFGPGKYLEAKPVCPGRGAYILNAVQDPPFCTVHGTIRW